MSAIVTALFLFLALGAFPLPLPLAFRSVGLRTRRVQGPKEIAQFVRDFRFRREGLTFQQRRRASRVAGLVQHAEIRLRQNADALRLELVKDDPGFVSPSGNLSE
jgi:hypothetical protein